MNEVIFDLVHGINSNALIDTDILPWSTPIPVFGDISRCKVATLGLNPSNLEFTDNDGHELVGTNRRFHTLNSLKIKDWNNTNEKHVEKIIKTYQDYFQVNPYDRWFKSLDIILNEINVSYYDTEKHACHLDLVPYATKTKWGKLRQAQQKRLVSSTCNSLATLLYNSKIQVLILNGASVINNFSLISPINFTKQEMPAWELCKNSNKKVKGYSYKGKLKKLLNLEFRQEILVLGFNHNIQSSFGVTNEVKTSIAKWIKSQTKEFPFES